MATKYQVAVGLEKRLFEAASTKQEPNNSPPKKNFLLSLARECIRLGLQSFPM
jgi:hypothetical protein